MLDTGNGSNLIANQAPLSFYLDGDKVSNKLKAFVAIVILLGLTAIWVDGFAFSRAELIGVVAFIVMALAFEYFSIEVPGSRLTVSVGFVPILTSILLFGAPVSTWVASFGSLNWKEITGGKPLYRNLFNFAQMALCASISTRLYVWAGGVVGSPDITQPWPMVASIAAFFVLNFAMPTIAYALATGSRAYAAFFRQFAWSIPGFLLTAPLGVLAALVYSASGYIGILLFILPLVLARWAFKLYVDMKGYYAETIQSLAQTIDAKDHYTRGHSGRVAYYAVNIAQNMGWSPGETDYLEYLALLHDIGKIGVREEVLNKRGKLTDEERDEINRHPELGAAIVEKITFLRDYSDYIRYHHERFGGGGYPYGIAGDSIPQGARIITVADAFDAMTSERVYHGARSPEEALAELQRFQGEQFDPEVVKVLCRMMEREDVVAEAHALINGASVLDTQ